MKNIILFTVSTLAIILISRLEPYDAWAAKLSTYIDAFGDQVDKMDIETRKQERYGGSYAIATMVRDVLEKSEFKNPVVLFQPDGYLKTLKLDFYPPKPPVFYGYTGLRAVMINSHDVYNATHIVYLTSQGLAIQQVKSSADIDSFIKVYNKYEPIVW